MIQQVSKCKVNFEKSSCDAPYVSVTSQTVLVSVMLYVGDTINPTCVTSDGTEDPEHFSLLFPSFDIQR